MISAPLLFFIAFACLAAAVLLSLRSPRIQRSRIPAAARVRSSRIDASPLHVVATEVQVEVTDLVRLSARIDEVWEDSSGALVAVETKTRDRFFRADVVQLSAAAYALRRSGGQFAGRRVSSIGFLRLAPPNATRRIIAIDLLTDSQVEGLLQRFVALRLGLATPCTAPLEAKCRSCNYGDGYCEHSIA